MQTNQKSSLDAHYDDKIVGDEVFVMRNQLFKHDGIFYMLANHPECKYWNEHVHSSKRYISRLDGFSYTELSQVDFQHMIYATR